MKSPAPKPWMVRAPDAVRHLISATFLLLSMPLAYEVHAAAWHRQTFNLHPGWNSIYFEVQPGTNTPSALFQGVPIDSVWTLKSPRSSIEFVQDPNEPLFSQAQWLRFIPTNRIESFQNNLFAIHSHTPYLVKVTGNAPVPWTVEGRPAVKELEWEPNEYVLRGFPVDPAAPPTFAEFFRGSPAHYDAALRRLNQIYRLNATGTWMPMDADDRIAYGEAYWVFTKGQSSYPGPFFVRPPFGDGLDFTRASQRLTLTIASFTTEDQRVTITDIVAPGASVLSYSAFNATQGTEYLHLPSPHAVNLSRAQPVRLPIALRRQDMAAETYETILEVKDARGTRLLIPVTGSKVLSASEAAQQRAGGSERRLSLHSRAPAGASPFAEAQSHIGLWSGTATISAVSEAHAADPSVPKPAAAEFNLRLLIHVDDQGVARLLKEVIQMTKEGTTRTDASGRRIVDTPARAALVTDLSKLGQFTGVALRDGVSQGRRLSSAGFDFPIAAGNNYVELAGHFAVNQSLRGQINLPAEHPTNPFLHRYHPDHDNLDPGFKNFKQEAYPVRRTITLEFTTNTLGRAVLDYGYNEIAGVYRETLAGLHQRDINVSGTFRLTRISTVGVLNE